MEALPSSGRFSGRPKILSYRKRMSGRRHTILGHRAAVLGPQGIHQREVEPKMLRSVATFGRSRHDCNVKSLSDLLHRSCQAALFCGASGTILRTPYLPNMRGRMAISFLVAALSSVSPNAKKPTLLPSQSIYSPEPIRFEVHDAVTDDGPLMPALDLAQDVFDIVRHAFRSGVKVLNLYYIKF